MTARPAAACSFARHGAGPIASPRDRGPWRLAPRLHGLLCRDQLGLPRSAAAKIADALETKPKPSLVWLEFQDCAGNTESIDYHETVMAEAEVDGGRVTNAWSSSTMFRGIEIWHQYGGHPDLRQIRRRG